MRDVVNLLFFWVRLVLVLIQALELSLWP